MVYGLGASICVGRLMVQDSSVSGSRWLVLGSKMKVPDKLRVCWRFRVETPVS